MPEVEVPAISFPEFLQLVEIRFLDDMRRRTSIIHAPTLGELSQVRISLAGLHAHTSWRDCVCTYVPSSCRGLRVLCERSEP